MEFAIPDLKSGARTVGAKRLAIIRIKLQEICLNILRQPNTPGQHVNSEHGICSAMDEWQSRATPSTVSIGVARMTTVYAESESLLQRRDGSESTKCREIP